MPAAVDPLESMAAALRGGRQPDPKAVAREFEGLLLGEMLKGAAPSPDARYSGGSAGRMYHEMFIQEVARRAAARGGLGLAEALGAQLQSQSSPAEAREGETR